MNLAAISTVEIHGAAGQSVALQTRLEALVETLQGTSGCAAFSLNRISAQNEVWIVSGFWHSRAAMQAHWQMPCLSELFALTQLRLATALMFDTFISA